MSAEKEPKMDLDNKEIEGDLTDGKSDTSGLVSVWSKLKCVQRMIVSFVVLLVFTIILLLLGMAVGFIVQQLSTIAKLEQESKDRDAAIREDVEELRLQLTLCGQCNLTNQNSSFGDNLHMQIEEILTAQTALQNQVHSTRSSLLDTRQQLVSLKLQVQENNTLIYTRVDMLDEFYANISEHVNQLSMTRDEHSDHLDVIRSTLIDMSTQISHLNGSFRNFTSVLEQQKTELTSINSGISRLNFRVSSIDSHYSAKSASLERSISEIDQHITSVSMGVSNKLSTIDSRLRGLEARSTAATIVSPVLFITLFMCLTITIVTI